MTDYNENLKQARRRKMMTQKELANKVGLSQTCILNYERRGHHISLEEAIKIAKALDIEVSEIYDVDSLGARIDIDPAPILEMDLVTDNPELMRSATEYLTQVIRRHNEIRNHIGRKREGTDL